jgi:hypothetical protein
MSRAYNAAAATARTPILELPTKTMRLVARDGVIVYMPDDRPLNADLEHEFNALASRWHKETRYWSSATKMAMHPTYQAIIALGSGVVPLILHDLEQTRGHWLWALHILSGFQDPAPEEATLDEAIDAWLSWGRRQGLLS